MMSIDPRNPGAAILEFLGEYHLGALTIVKTDGTPHVTPVGFTYQPETRIARVITWETSWKARHLAHSGQAPAAICSVDGGRWLTLSGLASLTSETEAVAEGVRRYTARYRQPKERHDRVVIELEVASIVGRA